MAAPERISVEEARQHLQSAPNALLVCAYDSQEKFEKYPLEGAILLDEFRSRLDSLNEEQEIIFYCA